MTSTWRDYHEQQMRDPAYRFWWYVWWLRLLPVRMRYWWGQRDD